MALKNSRQPSVDRERTYKATKAELAAIRKGEAEIAKGNFLTLAEFLHEMDRDRRKVGEKAGRKVSRSGPTKN